MTTETRTERDRATQKLYEIIRDLEVGMLTTVRADGTLHTRPMVTRFDESSGGLWFFTNEHAPKAREVKADDEVVVAYADAKRQVYASVSGRAALSHDQALMKRLWAPALITWFPKGLDDPDLALMNVDVQNGEFWDVPSKTVAEIMAAVQDGLDNPPPVDTGDHGKVKIR